MTPRDQSGWSAGLQKKSKATIASAATTMPRARVRMTGTRSGVRSDVELPRMGQYSLGAPRLEAPPRANGRPGERDGIPQAGRRIATTDPGLGLDPQTGAVSRRPDLGERPPSRLPHREP